MLNKMFDEFNNQYGLEKKELESDLTGMFQIIGSEYDEFRDEASENLLHAGQLMILNPHNFVKEGIDLVYATLQQLRERGVDVDAALSEVHRSNMSKKVHPLKTRSELDIAKKRYPNAHWVNTGGFGNVLKCKDTGKVIKPTTYSPAVITPDMWGE